MAKIYISHSYIENEIAEEIAINLRLYGHEVHTAKEIVPGMNWRKMTESWYTTSDIFIILISDHYLSRRSEYYTNELNSLINSGKPIIPVKTNPNTEMPEYLKDIVWINSYKRNINETSEEIIKSVNILSNNKGLSPFNRTVLMAPIPIKEIAINSVGIIDHINLNISHRLNIFTGDNGLGKSFILDVIWWLSTYSWPHDINSKIGFGRKFQPNKRQNASIKSISSNNYVQIKSESTFNHSEQQWINYGELVPNQGIIVYAQVDGSYSIWDPARNSQKDSDVQAYVFTPEEVLNGLNLNNVTLCNGMIRDWASWQRENGYLFEALKRLVKSISADEDEIFSIGELRRVYIEDARDIPTLIINDKEIPLNLSPASIRRIFSLLYLSIWSWQEHSRACDIRNLKTSSRIVLIVDEIESHLHPKWQRTITKSLMEMMQILAPEVQIQLLITTHSPLVMASVQPFFDPEQDAWFDLDLNEETGQVEITNRPWYRRGDASAWLRSEAFDLPYQSSREEEEAIKKAAAALESTDTNQEQALIVDAELRRYLAENDPFLRRWEYMAEKKGWIP